jgi:Ca-activated chloride channel family protein
MNLANPEWLLVWIALPILAIGAVLLGRFKREPWGEFTAERLRGRLIRPHHPLPRWLAFSMLLAAMGVLAFALARPQGDAGTKTETTKGRNVMIALDLSRSMRVQDVTPDRLGQAKVVIYELLETLENDRVGMVGFAGTPFLVAPLTIDHAAVRETVEQVDENWVSRGGSDIASAIRLATETLRETGQKNNALILISDGEEHGGDLDAIVADAERAGVTIFAIGVGSEDGGFVPHPDYADGDLLDKSGSKVLSRLQPDVLRDLANATGGRYVIAGRGADIPAMVEVAIQGMDVFEMEGGETRILIEFFQWAVLPGILFLMAAIVSGTRWRGLPGMAVLMAALVFANEVSADELGEAKEAFADERFEEARDTYRSLAEKEIGNDTARYRLAEGLSAYEAQDYRAARGAYSAALLSPNKRVIGEAHEGLGNTLFQLGWLGLSGSRYPVDQGIPNMGEFDSLVRNQLERMGEAEVPDVGETNEFIRMDSIILNWSDAVRHYGSALNHRPDDEAPRRNSELVVKYLRRLAELLEEEKLETEQEIAQQQQQGQGQPQQGQGQEGEGQEGEEPQEGEGQAEGGEGGGDQGEPGPEGSEGDEKKPGDEGGDEKKEDEGEESGDEEGVNPNESPEERARRLLEQNSDLEKGPLARGRREFRNPEKDW